MVHQLCKVRRIPYVKSAAVLVIEEACDPGLYRPHFIICHTTHFLPDSFLVDAFPSFPPSLTHFAVSRNCGHYTTANMPERKNPHRRRKKHLHVSNKSGNIPIVR